MKKNKQFLVLIALLIPAACLVALLPRVNAANDTSSTSSPRSVGGLHFDMDEGVEIEEGPGGSVYVKSNREAMSKKFQDIDEAIRELQERVANLESARPHGALGSTAEPKEVTGIANDGRRVLITQ